MMPGRGRRRDLVLLGGGHAHAIALSMLAMDPPSGVRITLVSESAFAYYSGMIPGCVAGLYSEAETRMELRPLCRWAGARFIEARVTGLDPEARRVHLEGRPPLAYDLVSIDLGSTTRGAEVPGAREHTLGTRPIAALPGRLEAAGRRLAALGRPAEVVVVGGGAAGIELAFCAQARLEKLGADPRVTLIDRRTAPFEDRGAAVSNQVAAALTRRGIVHVGAALVERVEATELELAGGERLPHDLVLWATGAAPHPLMADLGLPLDTRGFLQVEPTLQSVGHPDVFGAGDCVGIVGHPEVVKAGVYAVREGPVLARNLSARLAGRGLERYRPQTGFLALLALGDGRAIASWKGMAATGRWCWWLKDWIDRRFMDRFAPETLAARPRQMPEDPADAETQARCAGCGAKVGGGALSKALGGLEVTDNDRVVAGLGSPDDAALVKVPAGKLVAQTVDFFPAPLDDPWLVGRIATLHAASDLFAMGATPDVAMAMATLPAARPRLVARDLEALMAGVVHELEAMGATLVGGHTTEGPELAIGLSMQGLVDEGGAWRKGDLVAGDALVLTKPLGTGVLLAADMAGQGVGGPLAAAIAGMLRSNQPAAATLAAHGARGVTDVTGFGLLGHLLEMTRAAGVGARLDPTALPAYPGALDLLQAGTHSSLAEGNQDLIEGVAFVGGDPLAHPLLFDPQTSGGLLAGVPVERVEACLAALRAQGDHDAVVVGEVTERAGQVSLGSAADRPA